MKSSETNAALPALISPDSVRARRKDELAFLPAALEIVETPPSPIGRAIGVTIIAFFCLALAWASLSTVDIVATAPGKIIPSGRTKVIQPFEIGVVRAIHVQDGQSVKAGDVLIELDSTMNNAELEHMQSDLIAAQLDVARLHAALTDGPDPLGDFHPPKGASAEMVASQRKFLMNQITEYHSKLAALDSQLVQKQAERTTAMATISKIEALLPLLQQQVEMQKDAVEHEVTSKFLYNETLQKLIEQQQELVVQKSHLQEAQAAVTTIEKTRAQATGEYRRTLYDDLTKAEGKAAGLTQDVIKSQERSKLQVLTAPVDGVVQQLAVHTVGGVVTPAQPLLAVVPLDSHLEIEAMVSNRDIGFVHEGQDAEIKIETFNFTRYGLLHGRVRTVSQDAISPDKRQDGTGDTSQGESGKKSTSDAQEPVYAARVTLDRTQMQVEDKLVNLSPGMAVTVEIKTGSRKVISYLLSPLLRYKSESLRER